MQGVKEEVTFVDIYQMLGIDEKIDFIIDHISRLDRMMNAFEVGLITNIQRERRYNRCAENGELGVRVQTSGHADPTGNEGSTNGDLQKYIRQGNYMAALKGTDNFFKYKNQIITLQDMRDDYGIISSVVDSMGDEHEQYIKYLYKKNSIARAAEAEGVSTEAIKSRFYRAKKEIREASKAWMINSNKYSLLKKGA
ncbi:MAG: hypothetical protein II842_02750 [Butyrivibrio sp.]|nr:hypothetical protein [Butyrivibrio sp.]